MSHDETSRLAKRLPPADRDWIEMEIGETDPPARPIQWPLAFTMSVFFLSVAFTICFTVWTVNR